MVRVLIADSNLDSHELIDDLIKINFRDAVIEHAVTKSSFLSKLDSTESLFNLILYNFNLDSKDDVDMVSLMKTRYPEIINRLVCIVPDEMVAHSDCGTIPFLKRPISLDDFGEVVKKVCVY